MMLRIGPRGKPSLLWGIVLAAAMLVLVGAVVGFVCVFPIPFAFLSWPWATAVTVLAGVVIALVYGWVVYWRGQD